MKQLLKDQQDFFNTNITKDYAFRVKQLKTLKSAIEENETVLLKALEVDLGKSRVEAYTTEVGFVLSSISLTIKKLKKWMKKTKVKTPLFMFGSKSYIKYEPLGSVLIIGPYNYPFQLVIEPLIGAIAAGNTAVIKPSEYTKETEKVLLNIFNNYFEGKYIKLVTGNKDVASELTNMPFDHIFFTGSTEVGKIIYQNASKNLVPVTLELGGKSPVIVDGSANLEITARRIVFGKFINAGQTCIAPDYIYVKEEIKDKLVKHLIKEINNFYPEDLGLGVIVNKRHYSRLKALIDVNKVAYGNKLDEHNNFISPTILTNVTWDDLVMKEEIFGPILPVLSYKDLDFVIKTIKSKNKPLALYLFTSNKKVMNKVFKEISFGSGAINDTLMQVANPNLPFGGVGHSGIGSYHGKATFNLFSNLKSFTKKTTKYDIKLAYPPYSNKKFKLIKKFLK